MQHSIIILTLFSLERIKILILEHHFQAHFRIHVLLTQHPRVSLNVLFECGQSMFYVVYTNLGICSISA